jgi:hypothetical protein
MEGMEKLTAVEWLVEQYKKVGGISISMANQAKEMEKQQIMDAYNNGDNRSAELYYNETFKSE